MGIAADEVIAASRVTRGIADGEEFIVRFGHVVWRSAPGSKKAIFSSSCPELGLTQRRIGTDRTGSDSIVSRINDGPPPAPFPVRRHSLP